MKNLKSKVAVLVSLLMLTLVVTANAKVTPVNQNGNTVGTCGIGWDFDSNY